MVVYLFQHQSNRRLFWITALNPDSVNWVAREHFSNKNTLSLAIGLGSTERYFPKITQYFWEYNFVREVTFKMQIVIFATNIVEHRNTVYLRNSNVFGVTYCPPGSVYKYLQH